MSKPVVEVIVTSTDDRKGKVPALFDSGSFYTILRSDLVPSRKAVLKYRRPRRLGTAGKQGGIKVVGETTLVTEIGEKMITIRVLLSPDLKREMIIGAEAMQSWDITIRNRNGHTRVVVAKDMRDPEITEVD